MATAIGHNSRVFEVNTALQKTCRSVLCILWRQKNKRTPFHRKQICIIISSAHILVVLRPYYIRWVPTLFVTVAAIIRIIKYYVYNRVWITLTKLKRLMSPIIVWNRSGRNPYWGSSSCYARIARMKAYQKSGFRTKTHGAYFDTYDESCIFHTTIL